MGLFGASTHTLDDLFVHGLKTIYYAERQIAETLPKMIDMATDPTLRAGFEQHLAETRNQRVRLEQVFAQHGVTPTRRPAPRSTASSRPPTPPPPTSTTATSSTRRSPTARKQSSITRSRSTAR